MNIPKRIAMVQKSLAERNLMGVILSRYPSIGYFTGVYQRWGTIMFIPVEGKPFICSAEIERVQDEAWDPESIEFDLSYQYNSAVYYSRIEAVANQIKKMGLGKERIGFEKAHLTAIEMDNLKSFLQEGELVNAGDLVPSLMLVKSPEELKILRKLAAIADAGAYEALKSIRVGVTELEVSGLMDLAMKRLGAEKTWFPTHVASGYRSNFNMAYPTDKIIQNGDKIALDVGPLKDLYCGQLNVHVVLGKSLPEYKKVFIGATAVLQAIFDSLQPGKKASELFQVGLREAGKLDFGEVLPHFGRGIGIIDNEELLTFSPKCETVLRPGMVIAIITYLREGKYVISNERMVEITQTGGRWLCSYPLELVEI